MYKQFEEVVTKMIRESQDNARHEFFRMAIEALQVESWEEVLEKGYNLYEADVKQFDYACRLFWVGKKQSDKTGNGGGGLWDPENFVFAFKVNTLARENEKEDFMRGHNVTSLDYMIDVEEIDRDTLIDVLYDNLKARADELEQHIKESEDYETHSDSVQVVTEEYHKSTLKNEFY